ncbi:prepilin-type N-terminal cleavage/methylation domain-containing protein [Microbacterium sp. NEAU-LLC]|uniref:Prepilin-type N-terminal cleavage/methylation domain-containing protein n=1 Tax=Microbacterium helvum TaxID=2773713 RepID=A0ABR8NJ22_9MICO|nr:prepilin-type N-terminal cleavage/methylation domain-containing protein [Microbacterium helvum]MBD3940680.1 prepilin-type N-terminal cleavage/methylation domain-containing protein [Microbacterium helvum]
MRATIKNYLEAMKQRREEEGEKGFSLIELIIVVVILGILVAIAVPIFVDIQGKAADNAVKAAAGNGATAAAAQFADGGTAAEAQAAAQSAGDSDITVDFSSTGTNDSVTTVCVIAYSSNGSQYKDAASGYESGPGC